MLNKKQLIIMWIIGIIICVFFIVTSHHVEYSIDRSESWLSSGLRCHVYTEWDRAVLYPLIIIGGLFFITFRRKSLPPAK